MIERCIQHVFVKLALCLLLTQSPQLVSTFVMTSSGQAGQICVCSRHTSLFIYPTTNELGRPIGALYTDDCKLYDMTTGLKGDFLPVVHDHQIGYVYYDAQVDLIPCPNFVVASSDRLTTPVLSISTTKRPPSAHVTTKATPTQPLPTTSSTASTIIQPIGCNTKALFTEIAYNKNVGIHNSAQCSDGIHYDSDAVIMAFCSAPEPSLWLQGLQVAAHCKQIAQFTPIAVFSKHSTYQESAAILLECDQNFVYVAKQDCSSGLQIHKITPNDNPSYSEYHVIGWP